MTQNPSDPYGEPSPDKGPEQPSYGQQPYAQQPYGQPNAYGQPAYGGYMPAEHPSATTVLILGILGLVLCQVLAPFAWVMGNRVVREIDASGGAMGGRSSANAGRICGIVGTVLIVLSLLAVIAFFVFALLAVGSATTSP